MTEPPGFTPAREIMRMRAGSHLYGAAAPSSDLDLEAVVVPGARHLVAAVRAHFHRPRARGERNGPDDVDMETYGLRRYLDAPRAGTGRGRDAVRPPPDPLWREVQSLAPAW